MLLTTSEIAYSYMKRHSNAALVLPREVIAQPIYHSVPNIRSERRVERTMKSHQGMQHTSPTHRRKYQSTSLRSVHLRC